MKRDKPYIPLQYRQKADEPAVNRIRSAQSFPIQWSTPWRHGIFKTVLVLLVVAFAAHEAYAVVRHDLSAVYPSNGPLMTDAAGYRNNGSGGLNNVGGNGNFWTFAPNSQTNARNLNFNSGNVNPLNNNNRSNGFSVRPSRALGEVAGFFNEMRYTYHDIHAIVTMAYLKARENERSTDSQLEFEMDLEGNIRLLSLELFRRQWYPQPLDWFVNLEPTVREVFAPKFRDRVVSHVLFMMISPIFERYFVYDSFSCRLEKGTLVGIERLEHHIRSVTDNFRYEAWSLNYDISAFFMSIDRSRLHETIFAYLGKHQKRHPDAIDYDFARFLVTTLVLRDPLEGCVYHGNPGLIKLIQPGKSLRDQKPGVGIPIGDVNNQLCSNIYLTPLDWFIKRELRIRNSVRYVDDGKMLHRSYDYLCECRDRASEFLAREYSLKFHPNKTTITNLADTTYFLGAAIKPYRRYARNDTVARFKRYIVEADAAIASGRLHPADALTHLNSRLGYLSHFNERKMIGKALAGAQHVTGLFDIAKDYTKVTIKKT